MTITSSRRKLWYRFFDNLHGNRPKAIENRDFKNVLAHNRYKSLPNMEFQENSTFDTPKTMPSDASIRNWTFSRILHRLPSRQYSDTSCSHRSKRYRDAVICLVSFRPVQPVEEDALQLSLIQNMKQHSLVVMPDQETARKTRWPVSRIYSNPGQLFKCKNGPDNGRGKFSAKRFARRMTIMMYSRGS